MAGRGTGARMATDPVAACDPFPWPPLPFHGAPGTDPPGRGGKGRNKDFCVRDLNVPS